MSRLDLEEEFRSTVAAEFAFLVAEAGFLGPELVHELGFRIAFHRPNLRIEVSCPVGREPSVSTAVHRHRGPGERSDRAWLECLYVAAGCGPPQHVGGAAPNRKTTVKRVREHAAAVRRLLPSLTGDGAAELFARCPPSQHLPDSWFTRGGGPARS